MRKRSLVLGWNSPLFGLPHPCPLCLLLPTSPLPPLLNCTVVPVRNVGMPIPAPPNPAVPLAMGRGLPRPRVAWGGSCWPHPPVRASSLAPSPSSVLGRPGLGIPTSASSAPRHGHAPGAGWVPRLGGAGSAPLPPGEGHHGGLGTAASGAGGARRRDSGLCVPSRSAVSPYVPFLARCWAGPKFGTKPTVCANGETEAGAGGSHGGSQLLQVASKPSAQLQDTSSGHWKRLGFGRWSRAPPGLRHPAPLARAVPALPRPGAPSRSCSQGPVPVPLAPIGADVLYLSEIKNSGGGMERQEAQESSLVVRDRGTELTCSGGFGANTARIVIR